MGSPAGDPLGEPRELSGEEKRVADYYATYFEKDRVRGSAGAWFVVFASWALAAVPIAATLSLPWPKNWWALVVAAVPLLIGLPAAGRVRSGRWGGGLPWAVGASLMLLLGLAVLALIVVGAYCSTGSVK